MGTETKTKTKTTTNYWVVCEGTHTTRCGTEADARIRAAELASFGVTVLRIERQIMTTTTTTICSFVGVAS